MTDPQPFDPADAALIRRKARQIAGATRRWQDVDDYAQDLAAEFYHRLLSYDPAKGSRDAFAHLILNHAAARLLRRRPPPPTADADRAVDDAAIPDADRAADVAAILARLAPDLRALGELLMAESLTAAARRLGTHPSTLRPLLGDLRRAFRAGGFGPIA